MESDVSLWWRADEGGKVNKQAKCQHSDISEAFAALPFALANKPTAKFGRLVLVFRTHLQAEAPLAPPRGHFLDNAVTCARLQTQHVQFHEVCIIQSKC